MLPERRVGAGRGDRRRHLRQRPAPVRRPAAARAGARRLLDVPVPARSRDRRHESSRPGAGCDVPVGTRVAVDPAIPVRGAWHRAGVPDVRGRARVVLPRAREPRADAGHVDRLHGRARRRLGRPGARAPLDAARRSPMRSPTRSRACTSRCRSACTACCASRRATAIPCSSSAPGIIGLAAVAAVRALFPACEVTVTARHEHQAEAARAAGAHHVVLAQDRYAHFEELAGDRRRDGERPAAAGRCCSAGSRT